MTTNEPCDHCNDTDHAEAQCPATEKLRMHPPTWPIDKTYAREYAARQATK